MTGTIIKQKSFTLNLRSGFTLIEIMVTITIFLIVLGAIVGLFINGIKSQSQTMRNSEVLNNMSYSQEYISRALRMAKKDIVGACIGAKNNFINPSGVSTIRFLNYNGKCQEFGLLGGALYVKKSNDGSSVNLSSAVPLVSSKIIVDRASFVIAGNSQTDFFQPKVSFAFEMRAPNSEFSSVKVQTTVSMRDIDVPR